MQAMKVNDDKDISKKKVLETTKQMLHQTSREAKSPEMDWAYYWVHAQPE